jgi:endonuclease YncB( thermonuclease family)
MIAGISLARLIPGAPYAPGDDWAVLSYTVTDGDTVRCHLEGWVPSGEPSIAVAGVLLDSWTRISHDPRVYPKGPSCRLLYVNTPEKGKQMDGGLPDGRAGTWAQGGSDVRTWFDMNTEYGIRAETWCLEGNFGRLLADFYVEGDRGRTLSQYMLRMGWPPYVD